MRERDVMTDKFIDPEHIHPDFERLLSDKPLPMQFLYRDIRQLVLQACPTCNELLYHTHALSSVYSLSDKLKHAFCHIPVYSNHINLGFNLGADLDDPMAFYPAVARRSGMCPFAKALTSAILRLHACSQMPFGSLKASWMDPEKLKLR